MAKKVAATKKQPTPAAGNPSDDLRWMPSSDPRLTMRGLWWYEENGRNFSRLPLRAKGVVRDPVWELAQQCAGARLCFRTDARRVAVRGSTSGPEAMAHMPVTGHSGLTLYEGAPRVMKPWGIVFPPAGQVEFDGLLFGSEVSKKLREFTLYLPLYRGLAKLEIGLPKGAKILKPSAPALDKPVVFYGTSITQGGCAHTSGADFVSGIGRLLNLDVINFGFSGNGQGEPEMARLINEVDAGMFVLDYVANSGRLGLRKTLPTFVRILREGHPDTPIVLVSGIVYSQCHSNPATRRGHELSRDVMIDFYAKRRRAGDMNIHFIDGNGLIPYGADFAYSDIGVHPASSGFQTMAERMAPQIDHILFADG